MNREVCRGEPEHVLEQLFVGLGGGRQEIVSRGVEEFAAASWIDAAGETAAVCFGESIHGLHESEAAVCVGWVDAEVLGFEVLFWFGAEGF
jgi:hypothetical protein